MRVGIVPTTTQHEAELSSDAFELVVLDLEHAAVDMTVLRPGHLTEAPGTGRVTLGQALRPGEAPRDDVAEVMLRLLDSPRPGVVLEVVSGPTPIAEAFAAASLSVPG